jgi:hypothetical protein
MIGRNTTGWAGAVMSIQIRRGAEPSGRSGRDRAPCGRATRSGAERRQLARRHAELRVERLGRGDHALIGRLVPLEDGPDGPDARIELRAAAAAQLPERPLDRDGTAILNIKPDSDGSTYVQYRFTPLYKTTWRIDDLYVDPRMKH